MHQWPSEQTRQIPKINKGSYYLKQPRKPWLVSGVIREGTVVFLSGKAGTGKSFIGLELASCIAEGRDFFGNKVAMHEVLYLAAERGDAQRERLEALRDAKGVDPDCIHFLDHSFRLNVDEDEQLLYEAIEAEELHPKLIVIDTLRACLDGDENSSQNAQAFMDSLKRLRLRYDATIVVIHHVNVYGQARGSTAFIGAADTELYVTNSKSTGKVYLTVRKQNNGKNWVKYTLRPQEFDFGEDYSSIVLNLEGSQIVDSSPVEDEDNTADDNIVSVLEAATQTIGFNELHRRLTELEGSSRNKEKLKADTIRLHDGGMIRREDLPNNRVQLSAI